MRFDEILLQARFPVNMALILQLKLITKLLENGIWVGGEFAHFFKPHHG